MSTMFRFLFLLLTATAASADTFTGTFTASTFSRTLSTHLQSNRRSSSPTSTVRNVRAAKKAVSTMTGGQMQAFKYVLYAVMLLRKCRKYVGPPLLTMNLLPSHKTDSSPAASLELYPLSLPILLKSLKHSCKLPVRLERVPCRSPAKLSNRTVCLASFGAFHPHWQVSFPLDLCTSIPIPPSRMLSDRTLRKGPPPMP